MFPYLDSNIPWDASESRARGELAIQRAEREIRSAHVTGLMKSARSAAARSKTPGSLQRLHDLRLRHTFMRRERSFDAFGIARIREDIRIEIAKLQIARREEADKREDRLSALDVLALCQEIDRPDVKPSTIYAMVSHVDRRDECDLSAAIYAGLNAISPDLMTEYARFFFAALYMGPVAQKVAA